MRRGKPHTTLSVANTVGFHRHDLIDLDGETWLITRVTGHRPGTLELARNTWLRRWPLALRRRARRTIRTARFRWYDLLDRIEGTDG